jgi:predicted amidohydrolase
VGVVQLQLPVVVTPADLAAQTQKIVATVGKARRNMATMDIVVFPEYSLHGLSMDMNPAIMCSLDGPKLPRSNRPAATIASGVASPSWSSTRTGTLTIRA